MKKHLLRNTSILLLTFFSFQLISQVVKITNVRKREFKGISPVVNQSTNEVEGYYTFYVNEKVGGGMFNFIIALFDKDLKLIKNTPITISKKSQMEDATYNGKDFLFVFTDMAKKQISYITIDQNGEIIKTKGIAIDKRLATSASVYPAQDGFVIVKPIKEEKWGYSIERVDRNLTSIWEKRYMPTSGLVTVEAVEATKNQILVIQQHREKLLSKKQKGVLRSLNEKTGEEAFEYELFDGNATAQPSQFMVDKDGNIATGGMYFDGERFSSINSDGIFFLLLSPDGKKIAYNKIAWEEGIQKYLKGESFRVGSQPKVYFHNIVQGADGNYQVIGETFQKNLNMVPKAAADVRSLATGLWIGDMNANVDNNQPVTFEIMDFLVFNFDSKAELSTMYKITKPHTKVYCYYPYNSMAGLPLARTLASHGMFNFGFTIDHPSQDNQQVLVSTNFTKKERFIGIQTIKSNEAGKVIKIPIDKKMVKGYIGVAKAKKGNICIYHYDKKSETVNMMLQKYTL